MSYNGSGTFQINTSGQPVVAGTVISSTAFNALTADLATGLSTAITKDGQTTTTARIPFAAGINSSLVTDSSSVSTGSIITAGGVGIAKAVYVGTTLNVAGASTMTGAIAVDSVTDSTSTTTGSIQTDGGVGIAKALFVGTTANIAGVTTVQAGTAALPAITTTGDTNTGIFFPAADTIAFAEGGAEVMRIDSSGNVGIGTSSPQAKLQVSSGTNFGAVLKVSDTNSESTGFVVLGNGNSTDKAVGIWRADANSVSSTGTFLNLGGYGGMAFSTGAALLGSQTERMRIDSSGRVLVGTSTPNTDVKTLIKASNATELQIQLEQSNVTDGYGLRCSASDGDLTFNRYQSSAYTERMRLTTGGNLTISGATATKASGTTWANPSDQRLKNDIRDYTKGTTELMQVRVREWVYNGKGDTTDGMKGLGVIADEVMTVLPDTVENYDAKLNTDDEETTAIKKFDATEITWLLVKTVQEQQALITAQQASLDSLTARITALEAK